MSVSMKIKALMKMKGKKNDDLAKYLGLKSKQALSNKFHRDSFSAEDLIKISDFLGCKLYFDVEEGVKIALTIDDLRQPAPTDQNKALQCQPGDIMEYLEEEQQEPQ